MVLFSCARSQSAIDEAVGATRAADKATSDALATSVAQALAETQAAAPPGSLPSGGSAYFSDDFTQTVFAAGWSWIREDTSAWSLNERPGWLRLTTGNGDLLGPGGEASLLVHPAPDGSFELRARIDFAPSANFHFAGVVIYQDDDHFVSLGRAFCDAIPPCVGDGVYLDNDETFLAGSAPTIARGDLPEGPIWLRLVREGETYSGFWSENAEVWSPIGSTTAHMTPASVGLMSTTGGSGAAPAPAYFDLFQVLPLSPVSVEAAEVCSESMSDLRFVSDGYLASGFFLVTLEKPSGFAEDQYTLLVNGAAYTCTTQNLGPNRIFCTGRTIPNPGLAQVSLASAESSCTFDIPFSTISVLPKAPPTAAGGYD
jgi:hypothetical protein